jgi:hypothetical protein
MNKEDFRNQINKLAERAIEFGQSDLAAVLHTINAAMVAPERHMKMLRAMCIVFCEQARNDLSGNSSTFGTFND